MVLINNLTIDEINAALLHLQRARTEVVGGTKGSTVQNITISNKGGGSTVDYAPTITALSNRVDKNTDDIESVEDEIDKIQTTLEQLSDNGISSMTFDPVTRQLQINTQDGEVYSCDITSENITLNFDATTNKLTLEMGEQYQEVTLPYINANEKGSANGVATLDSSGRVPYSQLPESAMEFLGNWNASTNTPHLQDGTGTNGDFYVCNVGGTVTFGTGNTQTFVPNDRVIYNGASSQWVKLPAGQVSSVNGMSGDVTLDADDIEYSTGVTVKQKIDANAPVQADWTQINSSSKDFIKNKIPIWITNGSADDNMSPVSVVEAGNTRPVTSGGVAQAIGNVPLSKYEKLPSGADMNNYKDPNKIYYNNSIATINTFTNKPTFTSAGEMAMYSVLLGDNNYLMQFYYAKNILDSSIAKRVYSNGTWSEWVKLTTTADIVDSVTANNMQSVTSNAVAIEFINQKYLGTLKNLNTVGWYKIAEVSLGNYGFELTIEITSSYFYQVSCSHKIILCYGYHSCKIFDFANDANSVIDKAKVCWAGNNDSVGIYVHYNASSINAVYWRMSGCMARVTTYNLVTDSIAWADFVQSNLGTNGFYIDGTKIG